ncbi:Qat anti-phage system QueC-like protein QatC [uncultured Croceitalea sp.]|uniref:Qat anti-phage system QueC-like protein QatC n=1 Tax=uncultured Croceitalea sp. TaxID=1798908 RepID=UPI00374E9476
MKISIEVLQPKVKGEFANIWVKYEEDTILKKVQLRFSDFEKMVDYTNDRKSLAMDFLLVSAITYGIDDLLARKIFSFNGWTREIEVTFPVFHVNNWVAVSSQLEETLSFLTGDIWTVSFELLKVANLFFPRTNRRESKIPEYIYTDYINVSLFSGGLDSLMGIIDKMEELEDGKKIVLVSHLDPNYPGPSRDQSLILKKFEISYPNKFTHILSRIGIADRNHKGEKITRDGNQRSRSIMFIGLGVYFLNKTPNTNTLLIPENGTISLNHPLTPSRSSSLSTRTTHPHFLKSIQNILILLGLDVRLENPFQYKTKGDMVSECSNQKVLQNTFSDSVSCGKRGHKVHWKNRKANQCGICMPCIYRRAALHVKKLDNEIYGNDLLKLNPKLATGDVRALFDYLMTPYSKKQIMRNILVNGSIVIDELEGFSEVVIKSRLEIIRWIKDKGSEKLINYLNIK